MRRPYWFPLFLLAACHPASAPLSPVVVTPRVDRPDPCAQLRRPGTTP